MFNNPYDSILENYDCPIMTSTRFVVKPEGGQQCIFDYFGGSMRTLGLRGTPPPKNRALTMTLIFVTSLGT